MLLWRSPNPPRAPGDLGLTRDAVYLAVEEGVELFRRGGRTLARADPASPLRVRGADGRVLVATVEGSLVVLDLEQGAVLRSLRLT